MSIDLEQLQSLNVRLRAHIDIGQGILLKGEDQGKSHDGYFLDLRLPYLLKLGREGEFLAKIARESVGILDIVSIERHNEIDYFESMRTVFGLAGSQARKSA